MRVLLIQIREQPWKTRWDRNSFFESSGLNSKTMKAVNVFDKKLRLADMRGFDAVIIGGSKYGTYDKVPNMALLRQFIRLAKQKNLPMLGVCFGAQLIAETFGGKVIRDNKSQEFGTFMMEKTRAGLRDSLLHGLPRVFLAQCAHHDRVARLPPNAVSLARSKKCTVQVFKISGVRIYGVQFHPERSAKAYREGVLYELNQLPLRERELKNLPLHKILQAIKPTKTEIVLKNFLKIADRAIG